MENQIIIREAITENDVALFWEQLHTYYKRDMFPDPNAEEREYFLGNEYRTTMQDIHERAQDRCYYLFFDKNGETVGFALPVIYVTEDGKCFIMEFCIYPEHRGKGVGKNCADALLDWAKKNGASYAELNCSPDTRRERFWQGLGFVRNGFDEWGEPLMILPPSDEITVTVEVLRGADWQLLKLENGFKKDIGEDALTEEKQGILVSAIKEGKITFFVARRGYRLVGMCSVAKCYSTFTCSYTGIYDDFYVEPAFRKKGIARKLAKAAQKWCKDNGITSLTVCCAPCDEKMYQSLGFDICLGTTYAHVE